MVRHQKQQQNQVENEDKRRKREKANTSKIIYTPTSISRYIDTKAKHVIILFKHFFYGVYIRD